MASTGARQFLRQDERLQQPQYGISYSLNDATYVRRRERLLQDGPARFRRHVPACKRLRRARIGLIGVVQPTSRQCASARSCWSMPASVWRPWTCLTCSAVSTVWIQRHDGRSQAAGNRALQQLRECSRSAVTKMAQARVVMTSWRIATQLERHLPFNAGARWQEATSG